jgi:hypothetical protein
VKCYICNKEGKETDAIAICIVCGIAVCKDHQVREQILLLKRTNGVWGKKKLLYHCLFLVFYVPGVMRPL